MIRHVKERSDHLLPLLDVEDKEVYMLTTVDNPYNPFTQYDQWSAYDVSTGYNTNAYLSRIAVSSDDLSERNQGYAINAAINEILEYDLLGIYIKVTEDSFRDLTKDVKV